MYGVDKTGDVLDSAQAADIFDELYKDAILSPEEVEDARVASVLEKVRSQAETLRQGASILSQYGDLSPAEAQRLLGHPLPHWIERMTVTYLRASGGSAERTERGWRLRWPDETGVDEAVFSLQEAERLPAASHLTLEHPRIRGLATQVPRFVEGQPVPVVRLNRLTSEVRGLWCASSVTLRGTDWNRERIFVLFLHEDGRVLLPTARHI